MTEKLHRSLLLQELKETFPSITDDLNDQDGLLHLEVSIFCEFAQKAIDSGEKSLTKKCFSIASKYYIAGNQDMKNAIGLSFAKDLNFSNSKKNYRSWACELLSNELQGINSDFSG